LTVAFGQQSVLCTLFLQREREYVEEMFKIFDQRDSGANKAILK